MSPPEEELSLSFPDPLDMFCVVGKMSYAFWACSCKNYVSVS
jgi:hypothetical protein